MSEELAVNGSRARKPKPIPGEQVVGLIKAFGVELPVEMEKEMLAITDDEAASAYLSANLMDSMHPTKLLAQSVFSAWLTARIPIVPLLQTQQLYSLEVAKQVIADADQMLSEGQKDRPDEPLTVEQRMGLLRLKLLGSQAVKSCVNAGSKLAALVQPAIKPPKHRNQAPDVLSQMNVVVHGANGATVDGKMVAIGGTS